MNEHTDEVVANVLHAGGKFGNIRKHSGARGDG